MSGYFGYEIRDLELGWADSGACKAPDVDPAIFHSGDREDEVAARKICAQCPVKAECLQFAIDNREYGVWGGTTDYRRRVMRSEARGAKPNLIGAAA